MRNLIIVLITSLIVGILLIVANGFSFSKENYVHKKVVDLSEPFNGTIDVSYLKEISNSNASVFERN